MKNRFKYFDFETVTSLSRDDFAGFVELADSIFREFEIDGTPLDRRDIMKFEEIYQKSGGELWIIKEKNKVIGSIGLQPVVFRSQPAGFMRRFFVDSEYRSQGIGKELYSTAEKFAQEQKWRFIVLGVADNTFLDALKFYKKQGYTTIPNEDIPQTLIDDHDDFYFEKQIL